MADPPKLLTPGRIAEELGATLAQVQQVLRVNTAIRPVARAGTLRVYRRADLKPIAAALLARKPSTEVSHGA
jgi:hypothetical protein